MMSSVVKHLAKVFSGLLTAAIAMGCSTIDDDLSDCGTDYRIDYELRLVTTLTTELQMQLATQTDVGVATALQGYLGGIFTDFAHDIDLSFYDISEEGGRLHHEQQEMNNNEHSYTLYLPMHQYRHLALANLAQNAPVALAEDENCHTAALQQTQNGNGVGESHETGLFTARSDLDVLEGEDQTFHVKLYMANCAAALVIAPRGHDASKVEVVSTGFATGFNINDSIYTFAENPPAMRTLQLDTGTDALCFCSVNFPSRDEAEGDEALWEFRVYVTNADGTVTETVLGVTEPLQAGGLRIVTAYLDEDGSVHTDDSKVGMSITLDWNNAGQYQPEL